VRADPSGSGFEGGGQTRAIITLACVLALGSADQGALGAAAIPIEHGLGIGNAEIGVLAAVVPAVGLITTLPAGVLADRIRRTRLLTIAVMLSAVAMFANGAAPTYHWLLGSQVAFGAFTAALAPVIASLIGDYVPAGARGRAYGFVLAGELLGTGFGYVVCGGVAAIISWRWSFWVLVPPAAALVVWTARLPEPERGRRLTASVGDGSVTRQQHPAAEEPADQIGIRAALRYVLGVRSNLILIAASAMLYFFLAALRTFAVVFIRDHYDVGQLVGTLVLPLVGLGAVIGVLAGGRLGDRLMQSGRVRGRIALGIAGYASAVVLFLPGFASPVLAVSLPLLFAAAAALGLLNPPLDAARLDVIHHSMWGRSEGVRTIAMLVATAVAPLLFGFVSQTIGVQATFLVMTASLALAALLLTVSLRTYPGDVAAAERAMPAP
jgi:predicted MFS family arabinose efflux permease